MANWASTSYAIEGPKETLDKIYDAILHHDVAEGSSDNWEGNVLRALGCVWEERKAPNFAGPYMRGFINDAPWWDKDALRFCAEEAWGTTDFDEVLEKYYPDIKVIWVTEEEGMGVFETNDKEGKYFPSKYYVDTCVNGNYQSEYFQYKSDAFKWLHDITDGKVNSAKKIEKFNDDCLPDDYINFFEFKIID